jgi:hypothetical protein
MELFFNSAWGVLAAAIICLWVRFEERLHANRRQSFIAVLVLIVILFPAISISDDLWAINNPAETNTWQRRDHLGTCRHTIFPTSAALPEPVNVDLTVGFQPVALPLPMPLPSFDNPALDPIQNRPPPAA